MSHERALRHIAHLRDWAAAIPAWSWQDKGEYCYLLALDVYENAVKVKTPCVSRTRRPGWATWVDATFRADLHMPHVAS